MRKLALGTVCAFSVLLLAPIALASNDPAWGQQWGMHKVGAESAWATTAGANVVIAVIDTGVDLGHIDLQKFVGGRDYVDGDNNPQDVTRGGDSSCRGNPGHGTHVAGIAAAATNNGEGVAGAAPGAKIMPIRVLNECGSGSSNNVDEAIRWAADKAQVINLSLGPDIFAQNLLPFSQAAVEDAWEKGAVVVIAAGNSATLSGYLTVNAIVVGATDQNDGIASFSNLGDAKWSMVAPGVGILSTLPKPTFYGKLDGTSMAAPFVAGAAAVLRCAGLNKQQTVDRLLSSADKIGNPVEYGQGRLNMAKAVQGLNAPQCKVAGTGAAAAPAGGQAAGGGTAKKAAGGQAAPQNAPAANQQQQQAETQAAASPSPQAAKTKAAGEEKSNKTMINLIIGAVIVAGGLGYYLWNTRQKKRAAY